MRLLLVHDHRFQIYENEFYSHTFSRSVIRRYTNIFPHLTIVARCETRESRPKIPPASSPGCDIHCLDNISTLSSFLTHTRKDVEKKLRGYIGESDGVIVRLPSELGLLAASICMQIGRRYSVEVVGCGKDAMRYYGGIFPLLYSPILYRRMAKAIAGASAVSYVTDSFLQKRYPPSDSAFTISVSNVDIPPSDDSILRRRVKKIDEMGKRVVFGTIANLDMRYKGIDTAIRALSAIDDFAMEYRILGPGDGNRLYELAERVGIERILRFDGEVYDDEALFSWLDEIDIYLQPSRHEGLPRALIEAMSRGCPAIGSDAGGIPELLPEESIFPRNDSGELGKRIVSLCRDKKRISGEASRNFERAKTFSPDRIETCRMKFLRHIANGYERKGP